MSQARKCFGKEGKPNLQKVPINVDRAKQHIDRVVAYFPKILK